MFQTLIYLLLSTLVFLVILWYFLKLPFIIKLKKIPGPKPLPIIGNLHQLSTDVSEIVPILIDFKKKYGKIFKIIISFFDNIVVVTDPNFIELLLGNPTELNKSKLYTYTYNWLGSGLITISAEKWKKQRRIITPAFHFRILDNFLNVFHKNDQICIQQLQNELHGNSFDIYKYVSLLALDNIVEAAMKTEINAQLGKNLDYVERTQTMCNIVFQRQFDIIECNDFSYQFTKTSKIEKESLKVLHGLTERVIQDRKQQYLQENNMNQKTSEDDTGIRNKLAFLDLLLSSTIDGRPLTEKELRDEVTTFLFAGHDTSASAISFVLYCLSKHPEVQDKVVEEIRSILIENDNTILTYSDYQNFPYLEAVIKEGIRCYPIVPTIMRTLRNDFEYDGVIYPKGTTINILIYGVLQDPELFPNPEKFDPERFLGSIDRHPFAYIPFSAGPRNCIGQKFAMLEIKSAIVNILKKYEILEATDKEVKLSAGPVLKSTTGINVRIKRRGLF